MGLMSNEIHVYTKSELNMPLKTEIERTTMLTAIQLTKDHLATVIMVVWIIKKYLHI